MPFLSSPLFSSYNKAQLSSPGRDTPAKNSSDTRTPVSVAGNPLPPLCTAVLAFRSCYTFVPVVLFLQVAADVVDPT